MTAKKHLQPAALSCYHNSASPLGPREVFIGSSVFPMHHYAPLQQSSHALHFLTAFRLDHSSRWKVVSNAVFRKLLASIYMWDRMTVRYMTLAGWLLSGEIDHWVSLRWRQARELERQQKKKDSLLYHFHIYISIRVVDENGIRIHTIQVNAQKPGMWCHHIFEGRLLGRSSSSQRRFPLSQRLSLNRWASSTSLLL